MSQAKKNGPENSDRPVDVPGEQAGRETARNPEDDREKIILDLTKSLDDVKKQAEMYRDQLLRKAAEFENYRKRTDTELANFVRTANESLIAALLPILNDFVRSLAQGKESGAPESFTKGIELIYAKLMRVLEQQGLSTFESVGQPFDVQFHDALFMVPRSDVPPHTVVEEVEKGYKLHEKVLRHAKVIVSTSADSSPEAVQGGDEERLESD